MPARRPDGRATRVPRLHARPCEEDDGAGVRTAGIAHRHPHDLRHRYASVKIAEGVPVTTLAAQLGHSKKSMTLDVYSHVLLDG